MIYIYIYLIKPFFSRCLWQITDHVCVGVHHAVPGPLHHLHLTL